jgi:WD40 repeat protein
VTEPAPAGSIGPGSVLGQYRVLRSIGRGGMGEVFLARDLALGRRVALKVLHAEAMGSPEAVERFLAEARTTARFSHPHIVTVFGAGMHWGNPFVVLEYLEGETLRQRLDRGPLGVREAIRLGRAVADAVGELHRHGILHRDLKPENVLIPADGRLRVLDFGLAQPLDSAGLASESADPDDDDDQDLDLAGTPPYMAPELWLGDPPRPASDVWALGVLLYELLEGHQPYHGMPDRELIQVQISPDPVPPLSRVVPAPLASMVHSCLLKRAQGRPSVERVVALLDELIEGRGPARREVRAPFRGLLPWSERDADRFYGREAEVVEAVERLRQQPVLSLVGPSGAGKSSFALAGLLPRLREQAALELVELRPGRDPMRTLARAVVAAAPPNLPEAAINQEHAAELLAVELLEAPARLGLYLLALARDRASRVVLFVDQLEELVTLCPQREVRAAFMTALALAVDDPEGPARVLLALRDDFLGLLVEGVEARSVLDRVMVLGSPGPAALHEILTRPVQAVGYAWDEPELVARMVAEVDGEPAALPLLQVAGRMLWERRDTQQRLLLREAYDAMGGISGALALHADGVLGGMSPAQLAITRAVLLRLVTPERLGLPGHRQVVTRAALLEVHGSEAAAVVDRLVEGRLVVVRQAREPVGAADSPGDAELELVHESLITAWSRLARWIEEDHEQLAFLAEVSQAAELWRRRGRHQEELWRGAALHDAVERAGRLESVPELVRIFLAAGGARERRRQVRSRLVVLAGFVLTLAVAAFTGLQAREASIMGREAQAQRAVAEQRQAEVQREGAQAAWLAGDHIEARARLRDALELRDSPMARALWWRMERDPLRWRLRTASRVLGVGFAPDGCTVAAGLSDSGILLVDVASGERTRLDLHIDKVPALAWSPDGSVLATGSLDGTLLLWDAARGRAAGLGEHDAAIRTLAFSPDGGVLASADARGEIALWDPVLGTHLGAWIAHEARVTELAFSPDGLRLVSASKDGTLRMWSVSDGALLGEVGDHSSSEFEGGVAFHPSGDLLADAGPGHSVRLVDAHSMVPLRELPGHAAAITAVRFDPTGRLLATASQDETIRLWELEAGGRSHVLQGHDNWVNDIAFGPEGRMLVSGGRDQELRLWNLEQLEMLPGAAGHQADVLALTFSGAGGLLLTGDTQGMVHRWDASTGEPLGGLRAPAPEIMTMASSSDGRILALSGNDGSIWLIEASSGRVLRLLQASDTTVLALYFSSDDERLLSLDAEGGLHSWDPRSGALLSSRPGRAPVALQGRFGTDGRLVVAAGSDGPVRVWDVGSGALVHELPGHQGRAVDADLSPDGQRVASVGADGRLRLWSLRHGTGKVLARFEADTFSVAFTPDGRRLGVTCADGSVWLVGLDGSQTLLGRHRVAANAIRFEPSGQRAATTAEDGTVQVWDLAAGRPRRWSALLAHQPTALLRDDGWLALEDDISPVLEWPPSLLAGDVWLATQAPSGRALCLQTWDGLVQRWDLERMALLGELREARATQLLALEAGCVLRQPGGEVIWLGEDGQRRAVRGDASAIGHGDGELLVAAGGAVRAFGLPGLEATWLLPLEHEVVALAQRGQSLYLGFEGGGLMLLPRTSSRPVGRELEDVPPFGATALLPVSDDLLLAGFGDGTVGLWSAERGTMLVDAQLYGPVVHLASRGTTVLAATEMGDHLAWELGVLDQPYCALLEQVWDEVPVVWRQQGLRLEGPPPGHACR